MAREQEDRIVQGILTAISDHRLKAGTKLAEQTLCEIYGCSRTEVRRALVKLSAYNIVELQKNRGAFVAVPTEEEARNVFEARRAIEKTLARGAARLTTPEQVQRLEAHVEAEIAARRAGDRARAIRMSGDFHLILGEVGGNTVLLGFLRDLVMRSSLIIGLYATVQAPVCEDDDHRRIVEAIASRNEHEAAERIDAHLRDLEAGIHLKREDDPTDLRAILTTA